MQKLSKFFPIFIILLLSFWSIKPLFHSGFFPFHDDAQVQRVFEMKTALSDGIFPVRWVPDLGFGYGYPIFTFYAPFVYYIGGILNLTGFDSLTATKIMIGLGMLLAGMSMYVLSREFWGRVGAVVSSLLYVYAPYHAVNLYVRGAVSELWAYGLLPFVFFGIYKIYKNSTDASQAKRNNKKTWLWIIFTSIAYALVIVTHNLTAMMITPFVFVECLFLFLSLPRSQKNYLTAALMFMSLIIGIVLSAFYWLPAVAEMGYTNVNSIIGGGSDYKDHFICLSQLWNSSWGYGGSAPGCLLDGLSFRLGKVHIILASLSLIPLIFTWRSNKNIAYSILLSVVSCVISVFFLLDYSKFIWNLISQMAYFQFPWRFLVLVSFFLSFLGGASCILLPKKPRIAIGIVVVIAIIVNNAKLFVPGKIVDFNSNHYTNRNFLNWETSKISYEYMPKGFSIPKQKQDVPQKKITFTDVSTKLFNIATKAHSLDATIYASHATTINFAIAYFPAWKLLIDGKQVPFTQSNQGLKLKIPAGKHFIQAYYEQTTIEILADLLSLTGVIVLLVGIMALRKEKPKIAKNH